MQHYRIGMPHYRIVFFTHSFILTTEMPLPKFLGKLLREKSTSIAFSRVHDEGEKIPNLSHLRRRKYSTLPPPGSSRLRTSKAWLVTLPLVRAMCGRRSPCWLSCARTHNCLSLQETQFLSLNLANEFSQKLLISYERGLLRCRRITNGESDFE